jgi:putative oxidoreductase
MAENLKQWAPLPLRLIIGFGFIYHGFPKISAEGHQTFVATLTRIHVPAPGLMAWIAGVVEFVGGIALILGIFVTIASALLALDMLVALFKVHWAAGFSFMNFTGMGPNGPTFGLPGYEVNLLYIAGLVALILGGAGALSFDGLRAKK